MIDFKTAKYIHRRRRAKLWKDYKAHPEKYHVETHSDGKLWMMERRNYESYLRDDARRQYYYWEVFDRKEVETDNPNYYAYPIR
jgi:hypothetical protein